MSARILLIALDGADGILLDQLTADGSLPNMAALRARGGAKRLSAPEGITDDALWASFQFAQKLGEHGRIHWQQRLDSNGIGMSHLDEADRESFWHVLSSQGFRMGIMDVPKCGSPRPLNGIHLVDWLVHGRYFYEPKSYPESLAGEVVTQFGEAPSSRCDEPVFALDPETEKEVIANLRKSVAMKRAAGCHYLTSETWDLFVIGFKEAHCAGHRYWDLADPRHKKVDPVRMKALGDPLRTIFKDLDCAVGELVAAAGTDAVIGVFSSSDMEPNGTLMHLMPEIVNRLRRALGETFPSRCLRRLRRLLTSTPPVSALCELMPYNENCGALRVVLPGGMFRSPERTKALKAALVEKIESMLREVVDAETGQQVFTMIDQPSAIHAGPRADNLPDLLIRFHPGAVPRAVVSPQLGRVEAETTPVRPGNHAAGGYLIFTDETFGAVSAMQDFGPNLAARLTATSSIL